MTFLFQILVVFFISRISIWFFFIVSVSLQRFPIFSLISIIFLYFIEHNYDNFFASLAINSDIHVISKLVYGHLLYFLLRIGHIFLFLCILSNFRFYPGSVNVMWILFYSSREGWCFILAGSAIGWTQTASQDIHSICLVSWLTLIHLYYI